MLQKTKKTRKIKAARNLKFEMSRKISKRESPFIAANKVKSEKFMFLKRVLSQKRQSPRNAKAMKIGMIPTIALPTIGAVNSMVLVISEYLAV